MRTLKDPLTGEQFVPRRNNQRFANEKNRIRYNNNLALNRKKFKSKILKQLDFNWNILHNLLNNKEVIECSEDYLRGAGLHFGYLTHYILRNGTKWSCVFNYAYLRISKDRIKIVRL